MTTAASLPPTFLASMTSPTGSQSNGMGSASNSAAPNNTVPTPAAQRTYTQEEFFRFAQVALASAYSEQLARTHGQSRSPRAIPRSHSHPYLPRSPPANAAQQNGVMKPRMHLYESISPNEGSGDGDTQRPHRTMIATLELPGLARSDITVTARPDGELIIAGERHEGRIAALIGVGSEANSRNGKRGRTVFNELKFGRFQRSIRLPPGTDLRKITASMDDGMLTISWPLANTTATAGSPSPAPHSAQASRATSPASLGRNANGQESSRNDVAKKVKADNTDSGEDEKVDEEMPGEDVAVKEKEAKMAAEGTTSKASAAVH